MKLVINKDRSVIPIGTWGTKNENDYEILEFEFPEELENYNKRIVYYLDDTKPWDAIVDNKAYITNAITSKENVKAYIWCTKENSERPADTDFRSQEFEMHFYENENADGIVPTPVQVDGFNTMLTAMNAKIDEVDALETTIETAEAERQEAEATRVSNESTRESNESTRQTNEETRQSQEADRERRTDEAIADIQDKTAEYNANAEAKTNEFNQNATQKTNDFNSNYTQKVNDFNTNATTQKTDFNTNASSKTSAFNSNAETKTNAFNTNATSKTNAFNSNASEKTTAFDNNASTKTSEFNANAESKTTNFNTNATSKTNDFNDNATEKTDEFNTNAQNKIDEYDEHIVEYQAQIDELQEEVEELSENMPWNETEQATEISVDDAAKYSRNKLELFGNTYQLSLPSGYTHLEYIESTDYGHNRNYINTGIYPNNDTKIEMDFLLREQSGHSYDRLFGATDTLFSTQLSNFVPNDYRMHNKYNNIDKDFILNYSTKYNLKREKNKIYINDELKSEFEESVFQDTNELRLFSSVTSDRDGKFVLYFCKIWDNNTLVRDFVPCKNSNNEVGLYDFVSQTFFGNSGTRDFVAGNEVTIPNPNFPQDIHVVTGENTIKIENENLFDKNNVAVYGGYFWDGKIEGKAGKNSTRDKWFYIPCQPNTTYIIHKPVTPVQANNRFSVGTTSSTPVDKSKLSDFWHMDDGGATTEHIITTSNSAKFLCVFYGTSPSSDWTEYYPSLLNEIKISYFSSYPINLGNIELCKIGDYSDTFENQDGKWYKNKRINKRIFNSNSGFRMWGGEKGVGRFYIDNIWTHNYPIDLGYMTHFKRESFPNSIFNISDGNFSTQTSNHRLWMIHLSTPTLTEWGNWLSENPVTFYYILQDPILEEITDSTLISQLDEIYEHLQLVKGTNNIIVTAEDLAPNMQLSYMQDLPAKLDKLEAMVIENS